ncbi:HEPN domain-containing protein [Exiguobacterium sp. S22-S28]|uniref:ApeA N-terminal domain 1-containing protein n=1 Tax=Exiguobacterium sp. S22-S28 TaxID=3342768 RepID=UPI00372CF0FB
MKTKKIKNYLLNDEFEIKGTWMLPEGEQVAGILFYSNDQIRLELFNSLGAKDNSNGLDVIFGVTESGEEITLLSAMRTNLKSHIGKHSLTFETYRASQIFVGMHCKSLDDIDFEAMEIEFSYFPEWLGEAVFKTHGRTLSDKTISINELDLIQIDIPFINAELKGSGSIRTNNDLYRKAEFTSVSRLKLVPNEIKNFEWFRKQLYTLQKLMTVLTGRSVYILDLIFIKEEPGHNELMNMDFIDSKEYKLLMRQGSIKLETKITEDSFIMSYQHVKSNFGEIVNKWFESEEKLDVVYDLFAGEYFGVTHITKSFSNLMQSIEAFHRRNQPGTLIKSEDYDLYLNKINDYIKNTAPDRLKDKLIGSIKYGNEYSLRHRLIQLTDSLSSESRILIFGDESNIKKFIQKLVDTRNYFTHYDEVGKSRIIESEKRIYAIQRLRLFMTMLLFKELGIKEEYIVERFKKDPRIHYQLVRANLNLQ